MTPTIAQLFREIAQLFAIIAQLFHLIKLQFNTNCSTDSSIETPIHLRVFHTRISPQFDLTFYVVGINHQPHVRCAHCDKWVRFSYEHNCHTKSTT